MPKKKISRRLKPPKDKRRAPRAAKAKIAYTRKNWDSKGKWESDDLGSGYT